MLVESCFTIFGASVAALRTAEDSCPLTSAICSSSVSSFAAAPLSVLTIPTLVAGFLPVCAALREPVAGLSGFTPTACSTTASAVGFFALSVVK